MADEPENISPSAMAVLRNCPKEYEYQYVKHLPAKDFREKRPGQWLLANEKGSLIHEVMQKFYEKYIDKDLPSNADEGRFKDIFSEVLDEFKKNVPSESSEVQNREADDIYDKCKKFIDHDLQIVKTYRPWKLEWDLPDDANEITVKSNTGASISIRPVGRIDRIDSFLEPDGKTRHLRIVDYKSGTHPEMAEKTYLQHTMYSMALDGYTDDAGETYVVDLFVYEYLCADEMQSVTCAGDDIRELFPPQKKIGKEKQNEEEMVFRALSTGDYRRRDKYDVVDGVPPLSFDIKKNCRFCSYKDICVAAYEE